MASSNKRRRSPASTVAAPNQAVGGGAIYGPWDWFRASRDGRSAAQKEFKDLPAQAQGELIDRMKRFREGRTRYMDVDDLGGGVKEIRVRISNNHFRVLFGIMGSRPVALTCFYKNQRKTEKADLDRAKARLKKHVPS